MNIQTTPQAPLLDLDLLRTLVAIAETGNFSSAAQVVHRTPSAVSMQVKRLEELLGRPVFVRDSRSVDLTADGVALLEHARRVLALNREIMTRFVTPDLHGVVRMGASDNAVERFLPDVLCRFAESYPAITVNVIVERSADMADQVRARRLDMALVTCEPETDVDDIEILFTEQLVWATCEGGVAAERDPLPISVWDETCIWRRVGIEALTAQNRAWRTAFQSTHLSGQRAAILADLAVAPVPVSALDGKIVEVRPELNLPKLKKYALGLLIAPDAPAPVMAAADHLRAGFLREASLHAT